MLKIISVRKREYNESTRSLFQLSRKDRIMPVFAALNWCKVRQCNSFMCQILTKHPRAFVRSASKQRTPREPDDNETERPPIAYLPYVAGVSERVRKVCRDFNIRTVFKSGPTLCSLLTKVKDPLPTTKQSNVIYEVPCTCGKVYIGETKRRL